MRHILANVFIYSLVVGLVIGAVFFAWARNRQLVIAHEIDLDPRLANDKTHPADIDWLAFGEKTYQVNCQNCHTTDGSGRGMYPPIQRMTAHLDAEGGRAYLLNVTLYGLYTDTYGAPMPPMPELSDTEIAAVTNYILAEFAAGGGKPDTSQYYLPGEVAELRGQRLSEWDVANLRPAIASARELGRGVRVRNKKEAPAVPEGKDE